MIHYVQFREQYIRTCAEANGVTMAEYADCVEEADIVSDWWNHTVPFLLQGGMSRRWWNSIMKRPDTYGYVSRWIHDYPDHARQWGHDMEWALAHVRRDAKAKLGARSIL